MAKRKRKPYRPRVPLIKTNERIRAREVRVVQEGPNGEEINHGTMSPQAAMKISKPQGLDLVEIAPHARPPVCRICDYGKYKYDKAKKKKEQPKVKGGKTKEVKFRVGIEQHDYELKMRRGETFLAEGNKLRVQLMFRGRQMAHKDIGFDLMDRVVADFKKMAVVEVRPRLSGRFISMQLAPLPEKERVRVFTAEGDTSDDIEDDEEAHEAALDLNEEDHGDDEEEAPVKEEKTASKKK